MLLDAFPSFLSVLIFLIGFLIIQLIIIPYLKVNSHKGKQGVETYFYPVMGAFRRPKQDLETKGDAMATNKESSQKFPDPKYIVSNLNSNLVFGLRHPNYVKEFVHKQELYKKAKFVRVLKVLGNGLVTLEGEIWKRHRKIISSAFNYEFIKMRTSTVQEITKELFQKISSSEYDRYSVLDRMDEITGEVVGRIFLGWTISDYNYKGQSITKTLSELMGDLAACIRTPLVALFGHEVLNVPIIPKYKKMMDKVKGFRGVCLKLIQDRKSQPQKGNDLLSLLLETQKSEDPEQRLSDEDIVDEFITFFNAGMDTTGHLITMTLYNLTQYPQFLDDLQEERNKTYNKEKIINVETLQKMDVLHSIIKETIRFHTPAPGFAPREAIVDHELLDLKIKKGELVRCELISMFMNEKYFENSLDFNPARWKSEPKLDPYAFIPFSGGSRNCIGQHLAIIEAKIIISEFLERFSFKLQDGYKLRMILRFSYEPVDEMIFKLTPKVK